MSTWIGRVQGGLVVAGPGPADRLASAAAPRLPAAMRAWAEEARPMAEWAARHGEDDLGAVLLLDEGDAVVLAEGTPPRPADPLAPPGPRMRVEPIPDVAPLGARDRAAGVDAPPALAAALAPPSGAALMAVVDAAILLGLPERLAAEGLEHRCLFRGAAAEDLAEAAPWLVALPPGAALRADLLTARGAGGLHGHDAALLFHAAGTLDEVDAHLRHYAKVRDADGAWVFLRYWDRLFRRWLVERPRGPLPRGFWGPRPGAPVAILARTGARDWAVVRPPEDGADLAHEGFLPLYRRHARAALRRRFLDRLADALDEEAGIDVDPAALARHYRAARDEGYRRERAMARRIEAGLLAEAAGGRLGDLRGDPRLAGLARHSDVHRAAALLEVARARFAAGGRGTGR